MAEFNKPIKFDDFSLYFAGYSTDTASLPEIRNTYKLFSLISGSAVVNTFNNRFTVRSGDTVIMLPHEMFEMSVDDGVPFAMNCLYFTTDSLKFNEMMCGIRIGVARILHDKNINESLCSIISELGEEKVYSNEIISLICNRLLLYVMRSFDVNRSDDTKNADSCINLCTSIMNYIDSRVSSIKNLSEVAEALGYNYSYLSNLFRKNVGITLNKYFISKKMQEAERCLLETKKSVSKISQHLKYSSVYAFSKAFKEYFGESPANYRKNRK